MTPLNTRAGQLVFEAGSDVTFEQCVRTTHRARLLPPSEICWSLGGQKVVLPCDADHSSARVNLRLPSQFRRPRQMRVERSIASGDTHSEISWEVWVLPKPHNIPDWVLLHGDVTGQLKDIFPDAKVLAPGRPVPECTAAVIARVMSK